MPVTKSAQKSLRKEAKRRKRNIIYKKDIRNLFKEVKSLISKKKLEEAKKLLPKIYKSLDKAAKTGVIKKNAASRRKSRITKMTSVKIKTEDAKK